MTADNTFFSAIVDILPGEHAMRVANNVRSAGYEVEIYGRGDSQRLRGVPRDGSLWRERRPHRKTQYGHGVTPGGGGPDFPGAA